ITPAAASGSILSNSRRVCRRPGATRSFTPVLRAPAASGCVTWRAIRLARRVVEASEPGNHARGSEKECRTTMKLARTALLALAALTAATLTYAAKNPIVGGKEMFPTRNIVENAVNSADHTTLVAAVKAAGLVDTLQGPGPFTVFAPTNA